MAANSQPHFFTVIICPVQLRRLKIPDKFVSKHGHLLPDHVHLQAPKGEMWPVDLVKQKGEIFLGKGWCEFAAHYSIGIWQFIVFRYDWNSCFHVIIFDLGATEIDYPSNILPRITNVEHHGPSVTELVDDVDEGDVCYFDSESGEDEEDDTSSVEILENYPSGCFEKVEHKTLSVLDDDQSVQACPGVREERFGSKKREAKQKKNVRVLKDDKQKVLKRAAAFKSRNPHFIVGITPTYLHSNYLHIPTIHSAVYCKAEKGENTVVLHRFNDGELKRWTVGYRSVDSRPTEVRFRIGWKDFVRDNKLQAGDVCIFELTDPVAMSYNVGVYRVNGRDDDDWSVLRCKSSATAKKLDVGPSHLPRKRQRKEPASYREGRVTHCTAPKRSNSNGSRRNTQSIKESSVMQRANAFKSNNPYFVICIYPSYACRGYMHIPSSHSKRYFSDKGDENFVTLCRRGQGTKWKVRSSFSQKTSSVKLTTGWVNFASQNGLQAGDGCVFELVDARDMVYMVTVFGMRR